jgi:glycosyltransferase involved in cell wall biosynthesis
MSTALESPARPATIRAADVADQSPHTAGVWIVVPAYNESRRLAVTLRTLEPDYPNVVVIDDGSRDDTALAAFDAGAWIVRHPLNCGQGAALQTGIDFALRQGAQYIVTFDADGQHCAGEIASLIEPLQSGHVDVVLGSRFLGRTINMPRLRWLLLKAGVVFTRVFSRIRVTDTHNGFRALSRAAAQTIRIQENRMAHASEILHQIRLLGLRYCERPVTIRYSTETLTKGQSSWNAVAILSQFILGRFVR